MSNSPPSRPEERGTGWYVPAADGGGPSPVDGLTMAEFEELTAQIRRFQALSPAARLERLVINWEEQEFFERLRPVSEPDAG